jgi:hypothetical protein
VLIGKYRVDNLVKATITRAIGMCESTTERRYSACLAAHFFPLGPSKGTGAQKSFPWQGVSAPERRKEGGDFVENAFPRCRKCSEGDLVPLSDFGSQGASIEYKAWVCTNPSCLYNIKIRNGDIIINEPISDGSLHTYRSGRQ